MRFRLLRRLDASGAGVSLSLQFVEKDAVDKARLRERVGEGGADGLRAADLRATEDDDGIMVVAQRTMRFK